MREHLKLFKWYGRLKEPILAYYKHSEDSFMIFFYYGGEAGWDWSWVNPKAYYEDLPKTPTSDKLEKLIKMLFEPKLSSWKPVK